MSGPPVLAVPFAARSPPPDDRPAATFGALARRRLLQALGFGALLGAIAFAARVSRTAGTGVDLLLELVYMVASWALGALPVGLALCAVEWRDGERAPALGRHALAAVAGAAVSAVGSHALELAFATLLGRGPLETVFGIAPHSVEPLLFYLWQALFFGGLVTAGRFAQGQALRAQDALFVAEQAQAVRERALEEAKLAALQAEVEPEFLLTWLAEVERLYGTDPIRADERLGVIIDFLRASLAHLRSRGSSVGQEVRVAEAWFLAMPEAQREGVAVRFEVAPEVASHPMPPLVLLPLVRWLVARYLPGSRPVVEVRADSAHSGSGALIEISGSPGGTRPVDAGEEEWRRVEARMAEFDGELARMAVQTVPDGSVRVWIELLAQGALRGAPPRRAAAGAATAGELAQ